jgi:proteasome lid subunit RPN8/RPN11
MLRIGRKDYEALRQHGEETYPHECCGLLLGQTNSDGRVVASVARAGNTRTDSAHNRYNIDPKDYIRIQREARERGEDVIGYYHSHPDHPARWSPTDLAEAHWPGCSYVITSVEKGKAAITNSFELSLTDESDKTFVDERIEVSEAFASSGRVFVLGAGASAFAGYPLATGLLGFIRNFNSLEARTREKASRVISKLNDAEFQFSRHVIRDPNGVANLEELLTYLELYHSFPGTNFALNPWDASDSADIRQVVTYGFLEYQHDLYKNTWRAGAQIGIVRKVSEAWTSLVRPGDVIITFNWDILHEVILWPSGLWSYRDGYGFQCATQGEGEHPSKTLILKLHGSVNWVQEDETKPVAYIADVPDFFHDPRDLGTQPRHPEAQADSGRKLILPTYLKDISSNAALLGLWTKAHRFMAEAREMVVVGYSLNPVDHPARLLFGTALSQNSNLERATIVSPDTGEWEDFLGRMNKQVNSVREKFEDWVQKATRPGT